MAFPWTSASRGVGTGWKGAKRGEGGQLEILGAVALRKWMKRLKKFDFKARSVEERP